MEARKRLAASWLAGGEIGRCLDLVAETYLQTPNLRIGLPIKPLVLALEERGHAEFAGQISVPIIYDIYSKHIGSDRDGPKADALEDFLSFHSISRPTELRAHVDVLDKQMLVYLLRFICVTKVMQPSTSFYGTRDVQRERIGVCQLLREIDPDNDGAYADEIRSITQDLVISERVREIEQSKIYVDTSSIRRSFETSCAENFLRYQMMLTNPIFDDGSDEIFRTINQIIGDSRTALHIFNLPHNERDDLFISMLAEFLSQFVDSNRHGLDAYLSGRIRHGVIIGHLRSPIEVTHLATQKDSSTEKYLPNLYWAERYPDLDESLNQRISTRLAEFSEEIDKLVETLKSQWIQIRREATPEGLFDFTLGNVSIKKIQAKVSLATNFDEFTDLLFTFFWDATEKSLERVRKAIQGDFKPRVLAVFDTLQSDLQAMQAPSYVPELLSAVTTARTDMQLAINKVESWFRLSKATEKPDYDLETALLVAIHSVDNRNKSTPLNPTLRVSGSRKLRGSTLTALVDAIIILLENVVNHSGITGRSAKTEINAGLTNETLTIRIANEVDAEKMKRDAPKVRAAQATYGKESASALVALEGGTGFPKLWKCVTYDLKSDHEFVCRYEPGLTDEFVAELTINANGLLA